jgi:SAM-dependent methyltransferase
MQVNPYPTIDYDANDYDYQDYWTDRDYEQRSEDRVLRRLVPKLGNCSWFVDFGGAYGRNADYYLPITKRAVILDYSATNLKNAARRHADAVESGRLGLVRCDLKAIPFAGYAFDGAIVIRVLHHLPDLDHVLAEMGRCVRGRWLVDVPIKHHLLSLVRGAARGRLHHIRSAEPLVTGDSDEKYFNFQLDAVRSRLSDLGWRTRLAASANNFRRWDGHLPKPIVTAMRPVIQGMEACTQSLGRGWLGPSQFVIATRDPQPAANIYAEGDFTTRMRCPTCMGPLHWTEDTAGCAVCYHTFHREGPFWDFVSAGA